MKTFLQREIKEAYAYAAEGGQALHLMDGSFAYLQSRTPHCFKGRRVIAHLFDQDAERLIDTVKKLGVRVIKLEHAGTHRQHIDLCGRPLDIAIRRANHELKLVQDQARKIARLENEMLLPIDLGAVSDERKVAL